MYLSLITLLTLLLPQEPAGAGDSTPSSTTLVRVDIQVDGAAVTEMSYSLRGSEGMTVYALSNEGRPGVAAVIGGYGRTAGPPGKSGLSVLFFVHFYTDNKTFLEVQILNDATENPPGRIGAGYAVSLLGEVVAQGRKEFPDQAGIGIMGGKPRFVPRADLLAAYSASLPELESIRGLSPDDAARVADPDPVKNTHQTGSPRNCYVAVQAAKYLFTRDDRYLERLLDYVLIQSRRPYHLTDKNGEPFLREKYPQAHIIEGRPEHKGYLETFGRMVLTEAQLDADGFNGWDPEHLNVEELYAAYMMCGSRIARRDLVLIAEGLLTSPYVAEAGQNQHSGRAFGWVARALLRAFQATGQNRYLEGVRRMMDSLRAHRKTEGQFRYLLAQAASGHFIENEKSEPPFQVAVAASAIALYLRVGPEDPDAVELLQFCGDLLIDQGYSPSKGGFYYAYSVESSTRRGDGSAIDGVVLYIISPLVEIAAQLPEEQREKYLVPARKIYQEMKKQDWGKPSSDYFLRWLLRAAREFD